MVFGALFVLVWLAWPLASLTGGDLFVPLLVLAGLAGLPSLVRRADWRGPIALSLGLFFIWIGLSGLWSPAAAGLTSGSLATGNFAVEATWFRIGMTLMAGAGLVAAASGHAAALDARLAGLIGAAIVLQAVSLVLLQVFLGDILAGTGPDWLPSPQRVARNVNFFGLVLPLAIGLAVRYLPARLAALTAVGLIALTCHFALVFQGFAVLLGLVLGAACVAILLLLPGSGLRRLCQAFAAAILASPALFWVLASLIDKAGEVVPLSTWHRAHIWKTTLERIAEQPLIGHGLDASGTWQDIFASSPDVLERMPERFAVMKLVPGHPHNMALQVWAELGLVGALLLATIVFFVSRALPDTGRLSLPVKIACGGAIGMASVHFFISYSFWDETIWAIFAVILSGIIVLNRATRTPA